MNGATKLPECLLSFPILGLGVIQATQWSQLSAHRIFIVLRKCFELYYLAIF